MSEINDQGNAYMLQGLIAQLRVEIDGETDEDTRARLTLARSTAIDKLQAALNRFD